MNKGIVVLWDVYSVFGVCSPFYNMTNNSKQETMPICVPTGTYFHVIYSVMVGTVCVALLHT